MLSVASILIVSFLLRTTETFAFSSARCFNAPHGVASCVEPSARSSPSRSPNDVASRLRLVADDDDETSSVVAVPLSSLFSRRSAILGPLAAAWSLRHGPEVARAAPPVAVIAEELGYFPVTNRAGETVYVPARLKRSSTAQAVELARYLASSGAVMYGAFWCPHCQRQREMFGREAWELITYVECARNGVDSDVKACSRAGVDGFPTWRFRNGRPSVGGEMPLARLAEVSGYQGVFDDAAETKLPDFAGSCRLQNKP